MVDRIAPITGPTGYDYGRTPGLFDIAGLLDAFTPTRREIVSPSQTRFEEMDGLMYPVTTPAVYGEPETGIEYMPAYRAASSAADYLGGLLTGGEEEREMLVEGAKAVPGALAGQIDDYYTAMTQTPQGASGLVTPEGEVVEVNPLLPMEYLLGGSIGAMRAGDNVLGAAGGRLKDTAPARQGVVGDIKPFGGLTVREDVPNFSSISASLDNYEIMPSIQDVSIKEIPFPQKENLFYSPDDFRRVEDLAGQIKESQEINPLIVVQDKEGMYVLEGAHRLAALNDLGVTSFPAVVVRDLDELPALVEGPRGTVLGAAGSDVKSAASLGLLGASGMGGLEDMPLYGQIAKGNIGSKEMAPAEEALYRAGAALQLPRESGEGLLLPQRAYELGAAQAGVLDEGIAVDPGFQNIVAPFVRGEDTDTIIRDLGTVMKSPTVSLQNLIGETAKLMPGDMTMAGKEITHVMGVKLKNPVRMQGGKDFPAEELSRELGLVWASDPSVISGYAKQARENPGLLGIYSAMGARSGDFSHHVTDVIIDMTKQADWIPKKQIDRLDEEIRAFKKKNKKTGEVTQPYKDFPGVLSPKVEKYLYSDGKGGARKLLADTMEKATYRDKGFPDLSAIRTVVADPEMRYRVNDPSAMLAPTGGRIVRFDEEPMTPTVAKSGGNMPAFHKTYRQAISGEDLGALEMPVPRSLIFPEFFARRRAEGKEMSSDRRSAEISNVLQRITPEIATDVDVFQDMYRRGLLGEGIL